MEKENIIIHLITLANALQYAYDQGFHHGSLHTSVLFLDNLNSLKLGGFNTPLTPYVIDDNAVPTFCHPLPNVKVEDIIKDITGLGEIWIKMFLNEEISEGNSNYLELIPKMPNNYQNVLNKILRGKGQCSNNIIELRSNMELYIYIYI